MKLKGYLISDGRVKPENKIGSGRTKTITEDEFIKNVKNECYDILRVYNKNPKNFYYRGVSNNNRFSYIEPKNFERKSANTDNYYTLLMDNLPDWKNYPKRSKSIVFTNDREMAVSYGNCYILFPKNGAKIGIASDSDLWSSFPQLKKFDILTLLDLVGIINDVCKLNSLPRPKTFQELKKIMTRDIENDWKLPTRIQMSYVKYDTNLTIWNNIIPDMSPQENGFKLTSPKANVLKEEHEFWTDSDCYLLSYWKHEEILYKLFED
jgi:hypothetical protein